MTTAMKRAGRAFNVANVLYIVMTLALVGVWAFRHFHHHGG